MDSSHLVDDAKYRLAPDGSALLDPSFALTGRYVHLDVTRICCIVCVVLRIFDKRLVEWNTLYAQNWVLQLLWTICGICFCLTQKPLASYLGRLTMYFGIGAALNCAAWAINGWHLAGSFWIVIHQMNFVLCLIVICFLLAPVKLYMRTVTERLNSRGPEECHPTIPSSKRNLFLFGKLFLLCVGIAAICVLVQLFLNPLLQHVCVSLSRHNAFLDIQELRNDADSRVFGNVVAGNLEVCASGLWIVLVFPVLFGGVVKAAVWVLLANFYVHRLLRGYGSPELPFHGFYLILVAITAYHWGLTGRRLVGKFVHRYWMVVCFALAFLWTPGMHGNLTAQLPGDLYIRERYVLIEGVMVCAWLTAGQHMVDPTIFAEDKLGWVNEWALLAFLVHQAAHWLMPWPLPCLLLLGLGPLCWLARARQ